MTLTSIPASLRRAAGTLLFVLALALAAGACTSGSDDTGDDIVAVCGDGVCNERASSCPEDCDEPVDAGVDTPSATCGNHVCEVNEPSSCPGDCTVCGNHVCETNEPTTCASDCAVCGNQVCESGETAGSCASDCTATLTVRNNSTYRMYYLYVAGCGASTWGNDQLGAATIAPNGGQFTLNGIPPGCYFFRTESGTNFWQTPAAVTLTAGQRYTWTLVN